MSCEVARVLFECGRLRVVVAVVLVGIGRPEVSSICQDRAKALCCNNQKNRIEGTIAQNLEE